MGWLVTKLGDKYRDRITGFEGTATGRAEYLYEEPSVQITRADGSGKPESVWLAEGRLDPAEHESPGFGH